jgi:hypothetical protein
MPHVRFIRMDSRLRFKEILCPIEGFRSKKELERIAARKVPSWYALDYCGNPSRIVASRLLDFSCRRALIHVLLVIAVIVVIIKLVTGRRV